ncbi:MAG: RNA-protein complex protein Nop10 [Thaumarchaeota archaeon]|nr:RNA-protein complex protein Nop10 [Nitrososphaerota archaeon]
MRSLLLKCPEGHGYTLRQECSVCGKQTITVHPAKYSPDDKYARYRNPRVYQDSE